LIVKSERELSITGLSSLTSILTDFYSELFAIDEAVFSQQILIGEILE
jgi:hypothetical protein